MTMRNRIVVSPMAQYSAEEGCASDWHDMHLGTLAISGAALVLTEFTAVSPDARISRSDLGLWSEETAGALARIVQFYRKVGSVRLGVQLAHAGRKGSVGKAWEGHRPISDPSQAWPLVSASPVPYPGRPVPAELDRRGMARIIDDFVAAAQRADRIGVDAIEVHGAHGYLLHSFLSPLSNVRTDAFGGSLENRMRFPLELFTALRDAWPARKPMGMRISATDWAAGGWTIDDSLAFARKLRDAGCDYIAVSSGGLVPEQEIQVYPGYQVPFAERIRKEAEIPTVAVGLITEARHAEQIVAEGSADCVALGRAMLFNPRWVWNAASELGAECEYPPQYRRAHPSMRGGNFLRANGTVL